MTRLQGYFERVTETVTDADQREKYGSDVQLIRFGHGPLFRLLQLGSFSP
ncbi:hypothetical protein [Pseudomonas sp. WC2]